MRKNDAFFDKARFHYGNYKEFGAIFSLFFLVIPVKLVRLLVNVSRREKYNLKSLHPKGERTHVPQPRANIFAITIFLLVSGYITVGFSQKRRPQNPSASQPPLPSSEETQWWAAQRNIAAAIAQLEAYLRASPNGSRAATARQQITVLRSLSTTASRPEWARMDSLPLREVPEWRVASVEPLNDRTRLTIEIRCERADGGDCYFRPFDRFPLVLVDNAGQYYPMLEAVALPSNVKHRADGQTIISSGRVLNVTVDFAPLGPSAISGHVYYRDNNQASPATFSLPAQRKKEEQ